ncbi:hypothetical protein CR513_06823, partial [Mucuna pruriens]
MIVTPMSGSNYQNRATSMRRALTTKNKFVFEYGSIEVSDEANPTYRTWEWCNTLPDLKERFSQGDLTQISTLLQQEIHSLKHGTLTMTEYFRHL